MSLPLYLPCVSVCLCLYVYLCLGMPLTLCMPVCMSLLNVFLCLYVCSVSMFALSLCILCLFVFSASMYAYVWSVPCIPMYVYTSMYVSPSIHFSAYMYAVPLHQSMQKYHDRNMFFSFVCTLGNSDCSVVERQKQMRPKFFKFTRFSI